MTALITGEKTKAGVLSMAATVARADTNACGKQQLTTLFELAEDRNWATGIVTTTPSPMPPPQQALPLLNETGRMIQSYLLRQKLKVVATSRGNLLSLATAMVSMYYWAAAVATFYPRTLRML